MKATGKTDAPVTGVPGAPPEDPDFNDEMPAPMDPDASEFRDEILVTNYSQAGALRSELETERLEAEQATLEALTAMRAMDSGDQVKWRISRSGHENDELNGFLESWPNHQMTIERLRDRFGGGTYYCKGFRKGRYFSHQTLQISGEAKRKPSGVEGVNQSVPVVATPQFDMQGFLMAQERREEKRREDERRERLERQEREEKRDEKRMQLLLTLGPAAITALGGLFQGRQQDLAPLIAALKPPDAITMLTQLKALQGNGQDGMVNKILPMLFDMAKDRARGGDTGWMDVLLKVAEGAGPAVGGLIEAQVKAAQAASVQNPNTLTTLPTLAAPNSGPIAPNPTNAPALIVVPESQPRRERRQRSVNASLPAGSPDSQPGMPPRTDRSNGANIAGVNSPGTSSEGSEMNLLSLMQHIPWLREQLARMLQAAHRNRDPEVYAAMLMEELPDGLDPHIVGQLLSRSDWFVQVCQMVPQWNDARVYPWIEHARNLILQSLAGRPGFTGSPAPVASAMPESGGVDAQAGLTVGPAPKPLQVVKSQRANGEVDRPTRLPSLMGD